MVRLKGKEFKKEFIIENICFNSYMVRLKETARKVRSIIRKCFNSYMVRLKVETKWFVWKDDFMFQFLHGTIKGLYAFKHR